MSAFAAAQLPAGLLIHLSFLNHDRQGILVSGRGGIRDRSFGCRVSFSLSVGGSRGTRVEQCFW
jgi:hypothetical protein